MAEVWVGYSDLVDYAASGDHAVPLDKMSAMIETLLVACPNLIGWHPARSAADAIRAITSAGERDYAAIAEGVAAGAIDPAARIQVGNRVALKGNRAMLGRVHEIVADTAVILWDADEPGDEPFEDGVPVNLLERVYVAYDHADMLALARLADRDAASSGLEGFDWSGQMRAILSEDSDDYPLEGCLETLLDDLPYTSVYGPDYSTLYFASAQ